MKHTPGPWHWSEDGKLVSETADDGVAWGDCSQIEQGDPLKDFDESCAIECNSVADANLIAAAPELLDALIAARPLLDVTHPLAAYTHRVVESALEKATGEVVA